MNNLLKTIIIGASASLLFSCSNQKREHKIAEIYQKEISKVALNTDSMERSYIAALDEIDRNLQSINEKEGKIILGPGSPVENGISQKDKIVRNIQMINTLMDENRQKIVSLSEQLKKNKMEKTRYQQLVKRANEKLADLEQQLTSIKETLSMRDFEITELNNRLNDIDAKNLELQTLTEKYEKEIDTYDKETHAVFYATGTYRELKDNGVVTKKKLLGGGEKLKSDFKEDYFTKVDVRETTSIPVFAKKAEVITGQPKETYEFVKNEDMIASLEIKDPDRFWKTSKYLVVEVK